MDALRSGQMKSTESLEDKDLVQDSPASTSSPSSKSTASPLTEALSSRPRRSHWVEPGISLALHLLVADADNDTDDNPKLLSCIYQYHVAPFLHFDAPMPNQLYALGGRNEQQEPLNTVEMFDTWHGRWASCPRMLVRRAGCSAATLPSGPLLVAGGYDERGIVDGLLRSCELFDPRLQRWCFSTASLQRARWGHGCAVLNGRVYVVGGCSLRDGAPADEDFMETLKSCEVYDPELDRWEYGAPVNTPRAGGRVVTLGGRFLAIVGGCDDVFGRSEVLQSVELFDSVENRWFVLAPQLIVPRTTAAVAPVNDHEILVFGGTPGPPENGWSEASCTSCELFCVPEGPKLSRTASEIQEEQQQAATKQGRQAQPPPGEPLEGRMGCQAVVLDLPADGKSFPLCGSRSVVVVGGETVSEDEEGNTKHFSSVLVYDLTSNRWRPQQIVAPIPTPRTALALCVGTGRIQGYN